MLKGEVKWSFMKAITSVRGRLAAKTKIKNTAQ